jgi:hypothetical protein
VETSRLAIKTLIIFSLFASVCVIVDAWVESRHCYHGSERYSEGARVDFATGKMVCRGGHWEEVAP